VYFGRTFDFRCDHEIFEIQSAWNAAGPYRWDAFDNEQYGVYIVTRAPEIHLKIRVLGQPPNFSLEIDCDVPPEIAETTKATLLSTMFNKLLPAIKATAIRDTSYETLKDLEEGQ
jgi:hypothetical protein